MDHLVDVVLPCVHLKEPVIGFRSISLVKPAKLVIRNVGSEKLVFLRYNTNHFRLPDSLAKITINITHMKHLTVHPVKGQVAHSHLCQGDGSERQELSPQKHIFRFLAHLDKHLLIANAKGHVHHTSHKWVVVFTKTSLKRNTS